MPTRKVANDVVPCRSREHNPPQHRVFENGTYIHTCPECGWSQMFRVNKPVYTDKYWLVHVSRASEYERWVVAGTPDEAVQKFSRWMEEADPKDVEAFEQRTEWSDADTIESQEDCPQTRLLVLE